MNKDYPDTFKPKKRAHTGVENWEGDIAFLQYDKQIVRPASQRPRNGQR